MTTDLAKQILKELREELADKNKASNGIEYCIKIENQLDAIDYAIGRLSKEYNQPTHSSSLEKGARIVSAVADLISKSEDSMSLYDEYATVANDLRQMYRDASIKFDGAYDDGYECGYNQAVIDCFEEN